MPVLLLITASTSILEIEDLGANSTIVREPHAAEYLTALGEVPVAEGRPRDGAVGGPRPAAQHLVATAEEDLGVLAVGEAAEAGIARELRARPFPHLAGALQHAGFPSGLPLGLGGQ